LNQGKWIGLRSRRSAIVACVVLVAAAACSSSNDDGHTSDPEAGAAGEGAASGSSMGGSKAGNKAGGGSGNGGAAAHAGVEPAGGEGGLGGAAGNDAGANSAAGNGGEAGLGGAGLGGAGLGGAGPLEPGTGDRTLGASCVDSTDCKPGLGCIDAEDQRLNGAAPPQGLCTAECGADDDCTKLTPGAICYPFTPDSATGYCIEGCSFGAPDIGEIKCHARAELACVPALLADTGEPCQTAATCEDGELCSEGYCHVVFPGCLPSCRGDLDCAPGLYCDQSFLSGTCVPQKPTGKRLGEPCTVPGANDPAEPDECLGFCQADGDGPQGHCSATCGLARECAWDAASQKFDGVCLYASVLTSDVGEMGDFGFCTPACNCNEECNDAALECVMLEQGPLSGDFRGPGLCFAPSPDGDPIDECVP
jgi:hypothetical protein